MVLGYIIFGQQNDSWMLENGKPPQELTCPRCGNLTDFSYFNPFYEIGNKVYDFSHPYDIGAIVSLRFMEFCTREGYAGVRFKELEKSPGFYKLDVLNVIKFDPNRSGAELTGYCDVCGNYNDVIGTEHPYVVADTPLLSDGIYRTDYCFGSGSSKNPLTVVTEGVRRKLKREKMKGLYFMPIER